MEATPSTHTMILVELQQLLNWASILLHLDTQTSTWENDILSDVGVDATINHFDLTADWFNKKIRGLLFQGSLPNTIGGAALLPM